MQVIYHIFLPKITREFRQVSPDGDEVTDRLPDGSTDKSDDVWMERNFPGIQKFGIFYTGILVGIFTVNLADGWMDAVDNGHTN